MAGRVIQGYFIGGAMRPQPAPRAAAAEARPRHATGAPPPVFAGRAAPLQARMAPGRPPLVHHGAGHVAQPHGGNGSFEIDPAQLGLVRYGGKPLPQALLAKMEAAFGADFSAVRVHVGPQAARIGAVAFTMDNHLYFAPGRYQPDSVQGQQLIGHELAHVIQQRQGRVRAPASGIAVVQDRALEAEADRLGMRAANHTGLAGAAPGKRAAIQLKPGPPLHAGLAGRAPSGGPGHAIQAASSLKTPYKKFGGGSSSSLRRGKRGNRKATWLRELEAQEAQEAPHKASWPQSWTRAAIDFPEGLKRDIRDLRTEGLVDGVEDRRAENLRLLDQLLAAAVDTKVSPFQLSKRVQEFITELEVASSNVKNKLSELVTAKTLWFTSGMKVVPGPPAIGDSDSPDYMVIGNDKVIGDNLKISGIRDQQAVLIRAPDEVQYKKQIDARFSAVGKGVTSKLATYKRRFTDSQQKIFVTLDLSENPWITKEENVRRLKTQLAGMGQKEKLKGLDRVMIMVEGRIALNWQPPQ